MRTEQSALAVATGSEVWAPRSQGAARHEGRPVHQPPGLGPALQAGGGQEGSRDEEEDVGGQSSAADLSRGPVFLSPSPRIHPAVGCPTPCVHQDQYYKKYYKRSKSTSIVSTQCNHRFKITQNISNTDVSKPFHFEAKMASSLFDI